MQARRCRSRVRMEAARHRAQMQHSRDRSQPRSTTKFLAEEARARVAAQQAALSFLFPVDGGAVVDGA